MQAFALKMEDKNNQDVSEFLTNLLEGDMLNQNQQECEAYTNDFLTYLEKVLIPKMMELSLEFRYLYNRIYPTGSYFDGLRNVTDSRSTELDINIVLRLPKEYFRADDVQILTNEAVPNGFVKILCKETCVNALQRYKAKTRSDIVSSLKMNFHATSS